ncbi:MAG: Gfo/Idh/MocA family oxidoreductase [Dehalococcoidia bacterium]
MVSSKARRGGDAMVAVVGCGAWGMNLVRNFRDLGALAAVSDLDESRLAAAAEQADVPGLSLGQILEDPGIAALIIATPAAQHHDVAIQGIEAGKHIFVEKPLALNVAEAEEIQRRAASAGIILMVGHLLNYHPAFKALLQLVRQGDLGRLQYLASNRLNFGRFRREESSLWSFAPHDISMILRLVGAEPDAVEAVGSTHLHKTIADVTTTHLSFPGGEGAHVHVSWLHPVKEQRLTVVGDRGMAVFDDGQPWESKLLLFMHRVDWRDGVPVPSRAEAHPVPLDSAEPLAVECQHFLDCIDLGSVPDTDGEEGLRVLRVLEAAQRQLARRQPVDPPSLPPGVHATATIDAEVRIGPGTRVWHYAHVLSGSLIGRDCILGQNVMVGPNVSVGDGCRIQNNVSIYEGVTLERNVFCGPSMVFTNVSNPRAEFNQRSAFEQTLVKEGATIGANATIVCGNTIGSYSMVGAGSVVTRDVPDHALVLGVPAKQVGWVSHAGVRLGPDLVCPRSGNRYFIRNERLVRHA